MTDIPLYKRFKQAMTRRPKMKLTASESEQSSFSYWLKEKNRISSCIAEINNFGELVHTISLPTLLTVNQGNAEILQANKTLRLRSKEMLGMGLKKRKGRTGSLTSEKLLEGSRCLKRNRSELSIPTSSETSSKK